MRKSNASATQEAGSAGPAELSLNGWNSAYIDQMYQQWKDRPESVDQDMRRFFEGFDLAVRQAGDADKLPAAKWHESGTGHVAHSSQSKVDSLIYHYRDIGHLAADLDPLGTVRPMPEQLELESFGLSEDDLDKRFDPGHLPLDNDVTLREIIDALRDTYCRHVGVEYMHIQNRTQRRWLQQQMEPVRNAPEFTPDQKQRVLSELIEADALESFLSVRYQGKKRFSLEGADSLNPMLNELINAAPGHGIEELTIGMAHRGRINVLVNILQKTYTQLFTEFEEAWVEDFVEGGGDVKYHRGYSSDHATPSGESVRLTLSPNPSHLEFGHSVVLGRARAKQRTREDTERAQCVPLLIHGDASFPGQGIVAEMFNMAHLDGYTVGGAIHIVVNNQIGFTTNPSDAHSGRYCTDIAKMVNAPILHVNGDDPEACVFAATLALAYRQQFKNDVVIDMWCYRKYGHNEGDEPAFTQPLMYEIIRNRESVLQKYVDRLVDEGHISQDQFKAKYDELRERLDEAQTSSKDQPVSSTVAAFKSSWSGLTEEYSDDPVETGVPREQLLKVSKALGSCPDGFTPHRRLKKNLLDYRGSAIEEGKPLDWGMGEMLAYGTLLLDGDAVRVTGQDVERGTFSHRHAVVFDQKTGEPHCSLNHIDDEQSRFCIHNSPLTESACVGFEYGYSLGDPHMLIVWEAQFGDFANGAQVIFDQFIASAEVKWSRCSGLVCLLPHGYEGAGPEHSSARLERFLTLCAKNNLQVAYPTTPAQHFHLLRRQMHRNFRKPLIVMTPKSLLRHPKAVSYVDEFVDDRFHHVLDDPAVTDPSKIDRLLMCSGKVYYDLLAHRDHVEGNHVAIARIEQLYPLRLESLRAVLDRYPDAEKVWVQEEPRNMGAWRFIDAELRESLDLSLHYVGRDASATPAVASEKMHKQEQHRILVNAIGLEEPANSSQPDKESGSSSKDEQPQPVAKAG